MQNKTARVLAVIALVFMLIFSGSLIATLVDSSLMNGGIGYLALSSGVFSLMVFFALRADGKIASNRRIEMTQDDDTDDIEKNVADEKAETSQNVADDGDIPEGKDKEEENQNDTTD